MTPESQLRKTKYMRAREKRQKNLTSGALPPLSNNDIIPRGLQPWYPAEIGLENVALKETTLEKPDTRSKNHDPELDFASPDYSPPRQNFWHDPSDPSTNLTVKFCVVRVVSPGSFWGQNLNQKAEFHTLEKQMNEWYDNRWEADPRGLRLRDIIPGGFYAAYLQDYAQWVRVRVLEHIYGNGNHCQVYLLDYGYIRIVGLECLMFLRHAYNKLPIQAVKMEMYYEGEPCFTSEEKKQFDKAIGGKEVDVIPLSCSEDADVVFKTLRVVLMTRPVAHEMGKFSHSDFYNLNGRIKMVEMIKAIREFQTAICKTKNKKPEID